MIFTKDGVERTSISWVAPTQRVDGTAYGASDHAGYELGVADVTGNIQPWVSVPAGYDVTEWPLNELNINDEGAHTIALRTVDAGGRVSSWSTALVFTARVAAPNAPAAFALF
jgi:hypothetical protein